jgi:hypothetical protein
MSAIVTSVYTNSIPLLRCSRAPFAATSATKPSTMLRPAAMMCTANAVMCTLGAPDNVKARCTHDAKLVSAATIPTGGGDPEFQAARSC